MSIDDYKIKNDFNITIYNERLFNKIFEKLKLHHSLYRYPLKAEYWEDIWDQCMNERGSNWIGGGHQSGADTLDKVNNVSYQNKSGIINTKNNITTVTITSHRTSKHPTLKDKLNFISENHCDRYVLLSRDKKDWKNNIRSYELMIFESKLLDFHSLEWVKKIPKTGKNKGKWNGGYIGKGDPLKFEARIDGSGTSNQLHITINIEYIGGKQKFIIP